MRLARVTISMIKGVGGKKKTKVSNHSKTAVQTHFCHSCSQKLFSDKATKQIFGSPKMKMQSRFLAFNFKNHF